MGQVQAVVFDIGNVLIGWDPEGFYDARIGPENRRALFAAVDLHGMNERVDRGADMQIAVAALATAHPDHATAIHHWHDHWLEMASPDIPHSARLLRALRRRGVPVFALSNFGASTFEIAQQAYPVLREFDDMVISAHHGLMKPEAGIYALLETRTGLSGDALLFADDRADNIAAARARGWRGHLFTTPDLWAARLVDEGLLTKEEAA
ncbi:HAD-IA family hydrolase [Pseudooceanicola aestuarii]|uniref:HAD-IA family hydrolase n=1 Tax=Pseudooceanicola aestuarii TaxID=2697319 RepID=UPI0013D0E8FE|nr:HAD-IA family hydrolase [Pseudooceanicola aestuarii]